MPKRNTIMFLIILAVFIFTIWVVVPGDRFGRPGLRLGLDFAGGVQVAYRGQFSANVTSSEKSAAMDRVITVIQKRIDAFGVAEPEILKLGDDGVLVRLPGFTDLSAAEKLVQQTGFLEFREVERNASGSVVYLSDYLSENQTAFIDKQETGNRIFASSDTNGGRAVAILTKDDSGYQFTDVNGAVVDNTTLQQYSTVPSWVPSRGTDGTPLTGDLLADAQPTFSQGIGAGEPQVSIKWNAKGAVIFDQIAARLYDPAGNQGTYNLIHALGIFLDQGVISAPKVDAQKFEGNAVISGSFSVSAAKDLANLLKSGSLPVQLIKQTAGEKQISPTLGVEFQSLSWKAGLIGVLLVMLFMIAYYRLPGLMACLGLVFYGTLMLTIFKLWPITMSLGDIGGFIVSMGIAVDANVLIFERTKEEYRAGRTLAAATEAGFHRAWSAIWDSNVTTFIACIILYWLGNSALHDTTVVGFAITLFIGAIISIFTAVTVTRTLLRMLTGSTIANNTSLFIMTGGNK